jgi:hypothetical protein
MCRDDLASVMLKRRQGSEDRGRIGSPFHRFAFSRLPQRLGGAYFACLSLAPHPPTYLHELHTLLLSLAASISLNSNTYLVSCALSQYSVPKMGTKASF